MWLDLSNGAEIRINPISHNIQGARQPCYLHIGGKSRKYKGEKRVAGPGHGKVLARNELSCAFELEVEGAKMKLGLWWLEAAMRGGVEYLPIVNINPAFE